MKQREIQQQFFSRNELATYFGVDYTTIYRAEKKMRGLIGTVYSKNDFITHPPRIRLDAMQSYFNDRKLIESGAKIKPLRARITA